MPEALFATPWPMLLYGLFCAAIGVYVGLMMGGP
jgi:hypothetical protein